MCGGLERGGTDCPPYTLVQLSSKKRPAFCGFEPHVSGLVTKPNSKTRRPFPFFFFFFERHFLFLIYIYIYIYSMIDGQY
jgi:hypothetical protein